MHTLHSMGEALPILVAEQYHVALTKEILFALYCVEELLANGQKGSAVLLIETQQDKDTATQAYALDTREPETEQLITAGDVYWFKRVYVFDDEGNGIVCFERIPTRAHKRTE